MQICVDATLSTATYVPKNRKEETGLKSELLELEAGEVELDHV